MDDAHRRPDPPGRGLSRDAPAAPDALWPAGGAATPPAEGRAPAVAAAREAESLRPLTEAQIARVATWGETVAVERGARLWESGEVGHPMFVVLEGALEVVSRDFEGAETVIARHGRGGFTGESATLAGRAALTEGRAATALTAIRVACGALGEMLRRDAELGEVVVRAFMMRRLGMIRKGQGGLAVIGSRHSREALGLTRFLTRNSVPHDWIELETRPEIEEILDDLGLGPADLPVVVDEGEALRNPTSAQLADRLGLTAPLDEAGTFDLVVIGAGPAGLGAAVYAASEGVRTLVIEPTAPGGQAGSSSRIENYLGFPTGVSGQELADRAAAQAARFGAETAVGRRVSRLDCGASIHRVTLDGGETVLARAVVIATGARYRLPEVAGLDRFEGSGVYYAATHLEARLCGGAQVAILGGGNSAGQAAVFLAERAREVTIAVRGEGLSATMSRYLIDRIERTPNIRLSPFTEIAGVHGTGRLEALDLRREGRVERVAATHLFIFIGAEPNVDFVSPRLARDARGFLKTGADLTEAELAAAGWPPGRRPMLLESSCPRVFVAGDVRSGSTKRVAAAVGEGALAVTFVHRALGP